MRVMAPVRGEKPVFGLDVAQDELRVALRNNPGAHLLAGSAYGLPFSGETFGLVLCCEVMEHLEDPEAALEEIRRVGREWFLFSVPDEPLWRLLNLARGAYLGTWVAPRGAESREDAIRRVEGQIGRTFAIDHQYYKWDSAFPTSHEAWTVAQGRLPFLNWKAQRTNGAVVPWSSIASGAEASLPSCSSFPSRSRNRRPCGAVPKRNR